MNTLHRSYLKVKSRSERSKIIWEWAHPWRCRDLEDSKLVEAGSVFGCHEHVIGDDLVLGRRFDAILIAKKKNVNMTV